MFLDIGLISFHLEIFHVIVFHTWGKDMKQLCVGLWFLCGACSPADNKQSQVDNITDEPSGEEEGEPSGEPSASPTSEPSTPTSEPTSEPSDECLADTPEPLNECATDFINCGDEIVMSTEGGTTFFNREKYTNWYSLPAHEEDYEGEERAFLFVHPGAGAAQFTLESPCENTDLLYFRLSDTECPADSCSSCQQDHQQSAKSGFEDDVVQIFDTNPNTYVLIVESRTGEPTSFVLRAECP